MMKNTRVGFRRAVGPCILAGWVMPELVAAMCLYAFFADNGTLNTLLTAVFGIKKIAWLYKHAMLCVVLANIWHGTAFSMLMYQAALDNVPHDMEEAAIIDGANPIQILLKVFLPMSKAALATIVLFCVVNHWNAFFDGKIYINSLEKLPLQTYIQSLVVDLNPEQMASMTEEQLNEQMKMSSLTFNSAKVVVSMLPILIIYPFLQRYFVTGIVMGAVKE